MDPVMSWTTSDRTCTDDFCSLILFGQIPKTCVKEKIVGLFCNSGLFHQLPDLLQTHGFSPPQESVVMGDLLFYH